MRGWWAEISGGLARCNGQVGGRRELENKAKRIYIGGGTQYFKCHLCHDELFCVFCRILLWPVCEAALWVAGVE